MQTPDSFFAWADVWIGGTLVTRTNGRPDRLVGLSYQRVSASSANQGHVSLVDPDIDWLIGIVMSSGMALEFEYGWYGQRSKNVSPRYSCTILDVTESIQPNNVQLDIQFSSIAVVQNERYIKAHGGEGQRISDIVESIAASRGWKAVVDRTTQVLSHDTNSTMPVDKQFTQNQQGDLEFIKSLSRWAVRESDNMGGYILYFEDTNPPTLHFHPPMAQKSDANGSSRTYNWIGDTNSPVISWEPDLSYRMAGLLAGAASTQIVILDPANKQTQKAEANAQSIPKSVQQNETVPDANIPANSTNKIVSNPAWNANEGQALLTAQQSAAYSMGAIKATLRLMGDPTLKPQETVEIRCNLFSGANTAKKIAKRHPSSGTYLVMEVLDEVGAGTFTSTAQLVSNGLPSFYGKASVGGAGGEAGWNGSGVGSARPGTSSGGISKTKNQQAMLNTLGDPRQPNYKDNMVKVIGPTGVPMTVHKAAAEDFQAFFDELKATKTPDQLAQEGWGRFDGSYVPRTQTAYGKKPLSTNTPLNQLSDHAWGTAIDINAAQNPYGIGKTTFDRNTIDLAKKHGIENLGDKIGHDYMHWTWVPPEQRK